MTVSHLTTDDGALLALVFEALAPNADFLNLTQNEVFAGILNDLDAGADASHLTMSRGQILAGIVNALDPGAGASELMWSEAQMLAAIVNAADSTPTIQLSATSIAEDAADNSVVGILSVLNGSGTYVFSITADPDNKFAIANDDELQIDELLDYETATSHLVTIEADNGVDDPISRQFTITVTDVEEGDAVAPVLSSATDTVTGSTTADLSVSTDEGNGTLYWVVSTSNTAPSKAQVKAGQMHTGAAAADSGSQAVSATGAQAISGGATGLTAATQYYAHFMHEDAAANQSDVASGDGFTTYTAEAQAVFDAFTTPADATRKGHINTCVAALKTAGVWAKLDFLHVLAAAAADQALINWVDPGTFDATAVNSPTFEADRGYTSDGTTSYLNSGFNPSTAAGNYTLNDAHIGAWSRTDLAVNTTLLMGAYKSTITERTSFNPRNASGTAAFGVNGGTQVGGGTVANSVGHYVARRSASNAQALFKNGSSSATDASASTSMGTAAFFILAANDEGTPVEFTLRQVAADHGGASLSDTEIADFYTALSTYLTAVGAA